MSFLSSFSYKASKNSDNLKAATAYIKRNVKKNMKSNKRLK